MDLWDYSPIITSYNLYWLVFSTPLTNMTSSVGMILLNMMGQIKWMFQSPPTSINNGLILAVTYYSLSYSSSYTVPVMGLAVLLFYNYPLVICYIAIEKW